MKRALLARARSVRVRTRLGRGAKRRPGRRAADCDRGNAGAMKHRFVTACLHTGLAVGKQPTMSSVRDLLAQLHPVAIRQPMIRLGSDGDGGYLVPDDLEGIVACFSPGVDAWAPFEADVIARGIPCFMADASVETPPIDGGHFIKKFVGVVNDHTTIKLEDWVQALAPPTGDLILQMDIEGAEWPVLLHVSDEVLRRFRIIVVEMHDLERILDKHALQIIQAVFARLGEHFYIVHNHPNNYGRSVRKGSLVIPRVIEMTLLRKDRAEPVGFASTFPHPLDRKNAPHHPDVTLPSAWFQV